MGTKDRISDDIKTAMKAKNTQRLSVLRMVLSDIKYAQAAVNVHADLPEDEVVKVVNGYHKKLTKSLADYPDGEKRSAIESEIRVVEEYLPKKASEAEVRAAVDKVMGQTADRNFGALMKLVMAELGGGADGKLVSSLLKEKLG